MMIIMKSKNLKYCIIHFTFTHEGLDYSIITVVAFTSLPFRAEMFLMHIINIFYNSDCLTYSKRKTSNIENYDQTSNH